MNNIKIVFTDFDSTLTIENGIFDIKNKVIFERLADIGIHVVINTGRPLNYIIPKCKQLCTSNYVIASNGAEIYNFKNKKIIYQNILSKESIEILDSLIKKYNLFFMANSLKKRYTNKQENNIGFNIIENLSDIEDAISQVILESYDLQKMMELRRDLEKGTTLKIANKTKHVTEGKLLYYDVVNNDVSKGNALKILCDYLQIPLEKTMAIGDSDNDIDMLQKAEYKVAVENSTEKLKEVANIITLSNKQNGVEAILNKLYQSLK